MNEAGLVIYSMRLEEGSKAPKPDKRLSISAHFWLQYLLDNFSTIEEVMASDYGLRIFSPDRIPHYLVGDKYGNCAAIEFIDGKTVIHSGNNLPVKVLANTAYATSIAEWKNITSLKENMKPIPPKGTISRGRFLRAVERVTAFKPTDSGTAVNIAFDILKDISRANTNWSIVYDTKNLQVHFKTIIHSKIRMIDFNKLDFSCQTPVKMIDINEKLSGDITNQLVDYSFKYHFEHALRAVRKYELEMTSEELKKYILNIEAFPCINSPIRK
jgi:choloylglycine hydrolase